MSHLRIVILGGYGTFGRLIVEPLAQLGAQLVIAGRDVDKGTAFAASYHAEFVRCDMTKSDSLREAIAGSRLLINAAGPFQARDYSIPRMCIEHGCHYIDLGDGREYVTGISRLDESAKARGVFVCVGASTTPAITSAVVAELRPQLSRIRSIKVALTAGNRNQAGVSTISSILAYIGAPVRVREGGQWRTRTGWEMGEVIEFPEPVGRRRVQLCDVPDLELFPQLFAADTVLFKAGVELTLFNYAIAALAQLRKLWPAVNLSALAGPLVKISNRFQSLGTFHGSVAVWVTDVTGKEKALALVAAKNGPRVPSAPAILLARKVLADGAPAEGAFPCVGFLNLTEFTDHLAPFGITLVHKEDGGWSSPYRPAPLC